MQEDESTYTHLRPEVVEVEFHSFIGMVSIDKKNVNGMRNVPFVNDLL